MLLETLCTLNFRQWRPYRSLRSYILFLEDIGGTGQITFLESAGLCYPPRGQTSWDWEGILKQMPRMPRTEKTNYHYPSRTVLSRKKTDINLKNILCPFSYQTRDNLHIRECFMHVFFHKMSIIRNMSQIWLEVFFARNMTTILQLNQNKTSSSSKLDIYRI